MFLNSDFSSQPGEEKQPLYCPHFYIKKSCYLILISSAEDTVPKKSLWNLRTQGLPKSRNAIFLHFFKNFYPSFKLCCWQWLKVLNEATCTWISFSPNLPIRWLRNAFWWKQKWNSLASFPLKLCLWVVEIKTPSQEVSGLNNPIILYKTFPMSRRGYWVQQLHPQFYVLTFILQGSNCSKNNVTLPGNFIRYDYFRLLVSLGWHFWIIGNV